MILISILFFVCILFAPWWAALLAGCYLLGRHNAWFIVVFGGLVADMLYGAPIAALHGYTLLYGTVFAVLAFASFYFRATILE